jgi:hypothetical protein
VQARLQGNCDEDAGSLQALPRSQCQPPLAEKIVTERCRARVRWSPAPPFSITLEPDCDHIGFQVAPVSVFSGDFHNHRSPICSAVKHRQGRRVVIWARCNLMSYTHFVRSMAINTAQRVSNTNETYNVRRTAESPSTNRNPEPPPLSLCAV